VLKLRVIRKRGWLREPAGWAEDHLTTRGDYLSALALCVIGGLFCWLGIWALASRAGAPLSVTWKLYLGPLLFAIALPLMYVRSARALVLRGKEFPPSEDLNNGSRI
jgi:hypothetical protein